ncbi:flagellar basal body rod protein FlgC [Emcibacter sp.]|uniref:flagellar basal body rod protein FlgC n=1 Tax=Emcibacter sp. TaxID=1979954 RepID=UPI002AA726C0|nr:flagellar basal body rod C-terminal domain-containing protein [Emcibacter sp.]
MINAINTSLSGLLASTSKLNVAASNIANSRTTSTPKGTFAANTTAAALGSKAYTPLRHEQSSNKYGGVMSYNIPVNPASLTAYSPDDPMANEEGYVAVPNVNEFVEVGEMIKASNAYKANAKVLSTLAETEQDFLDRF